MTAFFANYWANLLAGATLLVLGAVGSQYYKPWRQRRAEQKTAKAHEAEKAATEAETETLRVLREQVIEVAKAQGINLAVSSRGVNPKVVKTVDGQTFWYFSDMRSYERGLRSGEASPMSSFWNKPAPQPVSQWSEEKLRKWLKDHSAVD